MYVSETALLKRLNRKLAADGEVVKKTRGARARFDLGEFYIVDVERNFVTCTNVDPVEMARELGVVDEGEQVDLQ